MPKDQMEEKRRQAYVWWNALSPEERKGYTDSGKVTAPDDVVRVWAYMVGV